MKYCQNCGSSNADSAGFCIKCGTNLTVQAPPQGAYQPVYVQVAIPKKYCRACGREVFPNAVVCVGCGTQVGLGDRFCETCGGPTNPYDVVCLNCGAAITPPYYYASLKSKVTAGLLGIFLGELGVHNFYLGYNGKAAGQLVLFIVGLFTMCIGVGFLCLFATAIWSLIEGIMILAGAINVDGQGRPLR